MATIRHRAAATENMRKAQARRQAMASGKRSRARPQGRTRQKPGSTGAGNYYHVAVRSKSGFVTFRTHDVGKRGHIQRVAGKRSSGSWATVKWLISKQDAHMAKGALVADTEDARKVLDQLGSKPVHVQGDRFEARLRPSVPEHAKPTPAQREARQANIKKAQAARHSK